MKRTLLMAVSFAIIGATLAVIDAPLADAMGFSAKLVADLADNNPAWMGTFFGMFGGGSVLVPPLVGKIFGLSTESEDKAPKIQIQQGKGVTVQLQQHMEPSMAVADVPFSPMESQPQDFTTKIIAKRAQSGEIYRN